MGNNHVCNGHECWDMGWVIKIVFLRFVQIWNCPVTGVNTTYGVYSAYYTSNNYFAGGTTLGYAWVGGLSVAVCLLCGPISNYISRKFGFRVALSIGRLTVGVINKHWLKKILLGTVCIVLGQCMAGICHSFGTFLVCQGIVFGIGMVFIL